MLRQGELLSVAKIDKINPGLVPRVRPEDLAERMPHEFAKVSFPLDWMVASKAVEELKTDALAQRQVDAADLNEPHRGDGRGH